MRSLKNEIHPGKSKRLEGIKHGKYGKHIAQRTCENDVDISRFQVTRSSM